MGSPTYVVYIHVRALTTCIADQNDNINGHHAEDHQNEDFILENSSVLLGEENYIEVSV